MKFETIEGISGVVGFAVAILWGFIKSCKRIKFTKKNHLLHAAHEISLVYKEMNHILASTSAKRVLILFSHNGGGIPRINHVLKSSVLFEVYEPGESPVSDHWQSQPLDEEYRELILNLNTKKKAVLETENMKGTLKNVYIAQDIKHSKVFEVIKTDNEYFYISITFKVPASEVSNIEKYEIRARVQNIRNVFEKSYKRK